MKKICEQSDWGIFFQLLHKQEPELAQNGPALNLFFSQPHSFFPTQWDRKTPNSGHFANFNLNFRWFAIFFCT